MTLLVITDKRDRSHAIDVAQERMLEDKLSEPFIAVSGAKSFQSISRAVKIFDPNILSGRV